MPKAHPADDMADACLFLMQLPDEPFTALLGSDEVTSGRFEPPLVNVGVGSDITIRELAALIQRTVGHQGEIVFDATQPDGTPRKLLDVSRLSHATSPREYQSKMSRAVANEFAPAPVCASISFLATSRAISMVS